MRKPAKELSRRLSRRLGIFWRLLGIALIGTSTVAAANLDERLLTEALAVVPPQWSLPFDSSHLVAIEDYSKFLKAHPELDASPDLQEQGRQAYAFTLSQSWPIYFNFEGHHILTAAYGRPGGRWVAYFIAAVLVHEAVHARGEARESAALLEELMVDRHFRRQGKLPAQVDIVKLAEHYLSALESERSAGGDLSAAVQRVEP